MNEIKGKREDEDIKMSPDTTAGNAANVYKDHYNVQGINTSIYVVGRLFRNLEALYNSVGTVLLTELYANAQVSN